MFPSTDAHRHGRGWVCAPSVLLMLFFLLPLDACADEIRQAVLQLRWGDAEHALAGRLSPPPQLEAWLDAGPGLRYRLDVDQARRAAGDLYALANRRVAVFYAPSAGLALRGADGRIRRVAMMIDAIVPADRLSARTPTMGVDGRVIGNTRWGDPDPPSLGPTALFL